MLPHFHKYLVLLFFFLAGILLAILGIIRRGHQARSADHRESGRKRHPVLTLLRSTISSWSEDRVPKMAAALAYYTAFAVAPLLLIAIAIAGLVFGKEAARGSVVAQIQNLVGQEGARSVQELLLKAWKPHEGMIATALGAIAFLVAATGVFGELQDSLNMIWKVRKQRGRGFLRVLCDRFLPFSMVVGLGFLLLVSLVASAGLQAFGDLIAGWAGGGVVMKALNFLISLAFVTAVFAAVFKVLPDLRLRWRDVLPGAAVTAVLFTIGKFLIGFYLGKKTFGSTYGSAGSFVVFLLWVNYSAQIVFLGATFTKKWMDFSGASPPTKSDAERIECNPVAGAPSEPHRAGSAQKRR